MLEHAASTGGPDPDDKNKRDIPGWKREIRAAIQNLKKELSRMPNNRVKEEPLKEAIKRGEDALKKHDQ